MKSKKLFRIIAACILLAVMILLMFTRLYHRGTSVKRPKNAYKRHIEQFKSSVDMDKDGIDDQSDILNSALYYIQTKPKYESRYYIGGTPNDGYGVCTDVVAAALFGAGYNLQKLVSEDIHEHPQNYDIQSPDENIDYRRVRNLQVYFKNNTNIVVTSKCIHAGDYNLEFEIEDYAASTENIMLAITAMEYAVVWMDGMMKFEGNIDKVRKPLNINCEETPRTIISFGKPKSMVIQKEKKHFLKEFILFSGS